MEPRQPTLASPARAAAGPVLPEQHPARRLWLAKRGHITRLVADIDLAGLQGPHGQPLRPGHLVLARVERLGATATLEDEAGRLRTLFAGDELLLVWHGSELHDMDQARRAQLLHASGLASLQAPAPPRPVTELRLLGRVVDAHGRPAALADRAAPGRTSPQAWRPVTVAVVGLGAGSGKTTAAASLARGLTRAGLVLGAAKLSGSGSCRETALLRDAGATRVLDHTDAGVACTDGLDAEGLRAVAASLLNQLTVAAPDVVVVELGDSLQHGPSADLLASDWWGRHVDGLVLCAADVAGAHSAAQWLHQLQQPVVAISGTLTRWPDLRSAARQVANLPVLGPAQLALGDIALGLYEARVARRRLRREAPPSN